jgi:glycosyltransferase involved in cell wall biosynthesis
MSSVQSALNAGAGVELSAPLELSERGLSVLFVVDSNFPGFGGAEIQARKLASALQDRGVYVEFVSPQVLSEQPTRDAIDGFTLRRISYPHIKLVGSIILLIKFALYIYRNRNRFDYIHIHVTRLLATVATAMKPLTGIPVITKVSGFFEFEGGVLDQRQRFSPVNLVCRHVLRKLDYVQTISQETREKLLEAGFNNDQIRFIPNGIDTRQITVERGTKDSFRVGYCGRLRAVKGVDVLLNGFAMAQAKVPQEQMQLIIAGDGEKRQELEQQAHNLGVAESVQFIGRIENTKAFYENLDVYVQPSYAEGLPNSVMEAMLAGRAVLASDIGGNRDLIHDGVAGRLFPAGDGNRLGELLVESLMRQDQLVEMGNRGNDLISEQYGFDRVATELLDIYRGK